MARKAAAGIEIGGVTVARGERAVVPIPVASLYNSGAPMSLPVHVVCGRQPGPVLLVCAAIHGDELNGVEIIHRLLRQRGLRNLHGTLLAVPVVNVFGIIQHSRYLPDRRDLNRSFPGSNRGSLAARLAAIFLEQIVSKCEVCIDLHTGAVHRRNLPQIRGNLDDPVTLDFARSFDVPVLVNSNLRDGSLRESCVDMGVRVLVYEAGEALRLDEFSVRAGLNGILHAMGALGMLRRRSARRFDSPWVAASSQWVRAPSSGMMQMSVKLGDSVEKGDVLGSVVDPTDFFEGDPPLVSAPFPGIVIGNTTLPLVNEGDAAFHIARFDDIDDVASDVDAFQQHWSE